MSLNITANIISTVAQADVPSVNATGNVDPQWSGKYVTVTVPAGTVTLTLPDATTHMGAMYGFIKIGGNQLDITTVSSQTITLVASVGETASMGAVTGAASLQLISDGVGWWSTHFTGAWTAA